MNNQTRNHLNLQKHIADQDHIIRVRNAEIAALRKRAEKAEQERDEWKDSAIKAMADLERAEQPRPLTTDAITDEMERRLIRKGVEFGWFAESDINDRDTRDKVRALLVAALTEPTRPEGAEKVEAVLHQYWSGDINGDDLADRIAEEMNR